MAGNWRVVAQTQREELTGAGTFQAVVEVIFELASGTRGTVNIPARSYTEENVRATIEQRASTMAAIDGLSG